MDAIVGYLIRQKRLEQNISQEGLCKGICVVSYLSKIEQGLVNPSTEIIHQLFQVLNITFYDDTQFVSKYKKCLVSNIESYFLQEDITLDDEIESVMDKLLHSPLIIDTMLYQITKLVSKHNEYERYRKVLNEITIYTSYMNDTQRYLFYVLHVGIQDIDERIQYLEMAGRLHSCSFQKRNLAYAFYSIGKNEQAIECLHIAYQFACDEGNSLEMLESSLLLGNCYSNTHDETLMRKYYKRSEVLARTSHFEHVLATMQYNIGSSYLIWNQLEEAEYYLLKSLKTCHDDPCFSIFLTYQKLAMLYYEKNDDVHLMKYLRLANEAEKFEQDPLLLKMHQFVQMYCDKEKKYSDEYIFILEELVHGKSNANKQIIDITYGFRIFHAKYLIDAYKKTRRYKEALSIKEQLEIEQFS